MSPLPYELDGHAQDDAERQKQRWENYKAFEAALFKELDSTDGVVFLYDRRDVSDFKEMLRTAWEKSQNA